MKLAVSGKGGVGKTTISASLSRIFAGHGYRVLAIDADPDSNLASALGMPPEKAAQILPISRASELIEERTGAKPGQSGSMFKLNPRVDDLPDSMSVEHDGIRLLVLGAIEKGGHGCICPQSALLKRLVSHVVLQRKELVLLDMEAGIEHLGRGTAQGVDALLVVADPDRQSIQTARTIDRLARETGIEKVLVVLNKVRSSEEEELLRQGLKDMDILGVVQDSPGVRLASLKEAAPDPGDAAFTRQVEVLVNGLKERL